MKANSSTYSAKDMCGSPATGVGYIDPGTLHQVTMDRYERSCLFVIIIIHYDMTIYPFFIVSNFHPATVASLYFLTIS